MHAMEFSTIWLFVIAAATLLIIPGPAVFYIMARSISHESEDSTLFLAFFPQFITPTAGSVAVQFLLLGSIFIMLAFISDGLYAILAASMRKWILGRKASSKLQSRITGYFYIVLGVFSAFASPSKT